MTNYSRVIETLEREGIDYTMAAVAIPVYWATDRPSDDEFNLLCLYVDRAMEDVDKSYYQLMADIVCDLYLDCGYGYRDVDSGLFLTKEDLQEVEDTRWNEKLDMVINMFYERY